MNCPACGAENHGAAYACASCGQALALPRGTLLADRYEIRGVVGSGGMATVYRAHDRELAEDVAVKVLRPAPPSSDWARRFRSEIRLARRVRHPNVCGIHECGRHAALRFVVMELVDGLDLKQQLRRDGPLSKDEGIFVALQICDGLRAIHDAGIVHRDLKTSNIMRDRRGVIRLLDFGIAKQTADGAAGTTAPGEILGTPEYMSPEQCRGERVDQRSDIYALGVVLFELLTGEVPFRGELPLATMWKQMREPPPLAGPGAQRLPPELLRILTKALAKEPKGRYSSVQEVAAALRFARERSPAGCVTVTLRRGGERGAAGYVRLAAAMMFGAGLALWPAPANRGGGVSLARLRSAEPREARASGQRPSRRPAVEKAREPVVPATSAGVERASIAAAGRVPSGAAADAAAEPQPLPAAFADGAGSALPAVPVVDLRPVPIMDPRPAPGADARPASIGDPTPVAAAAATIEVRVKPKASVAVDGTLLGRASRYSLSVAAGEHVVAVTHPDYQPFNRAITVRAGERRTLEVDLEDEAVRRRPRQGGS